MPFSFPTFDSGDEFGEGIHGAVESEKPFQYGREQIQATAREFGFIEIDSYFDAAAEASMPATHTAYNVAASQTFNAVDHLANLGGIDEVVQLENLAQGESFVVVIHQRLMAK